MRRKSIYLPYALSLTMSILLLLGGHFGGISLDYLATIAV